MSLKKTFTLFILLGISSYISGQTRILRGKVMDSTKQGLEFANIMAKAIHQDLPFVFSVTDSQGNFEIKLQKKSGYIVTVAFMGYHQHVFKVDSLVKPAFQNIILKPNRQDLDEVVIDYKTPVKITQDSIVYNVKHFVNGKERKLKAVLQKLPGVEVDKNGQIKVMGKKIAKVMVEGKDFFGGDSKLAVDNIPADAVKSIQVVKDYSAVGFMKGLNEEQKSIINIKLKEGKKRFVFGDITAGSNTHKDYLAKSNLFYYSPKTNVNYIGNLNNTGETSLSFNDIRRFENNDNFLSRKFLDHSAKKTLMHFASNPNFTAKKSFFNAAQWQQDFGSNWQFDIYALYDQTQAEYKQERFQNNLLPTEYNRNISRNRTEKPEFLLSKLHLVYNPKANQYIDISMTYNQTGSRQQKAITDQSIYQNSFLTAHDRNRSRNGTQSLMWYYKLSKKNIFRLVNIFKYKDETHTQNWQSDTAFLNGYIPMQNASVYDLEQPQSVTDFKWQSLFKYYYKINARNHLYFSLGQAYDSRHFQSELKQVLNGNQLDFNNFNNDLQQKQQNLFGGLQYRFRIGQSIFTPGVYLHRLAWQNRQTALTQKSKWYLFPEFSLISKWFAGDFNVKYQVEVNWPQNIYDLSNDFLPDYDRILTGNPDVPPVLSHHINLHYSYFSFLKGINIFSNMDFNFKDGLILIEKHFLGTNILQKPFYLVKNGHDFSTSFNFTKEWRKIYVSYRPFVSYSKNFEKLDNNLITSHDWFWVNTLRIGNNYKNWPDFNLSVSQNIIQSKSPAMTYHLLEYKPEFDLTYDYKNCSLKMDYKLKYSNQNQVWKNTGNNLSVSLRYQKPDKAFGVSISCINILNQNYLINYRQTPYLIERNIVYKQARMVLLKLHYKL